MAGTAANPFGASVAALVTVQALIGDSAGSGGIAATNGLAIAIECRVDRQCRRVRSDGESGKSLGSPGADCVEGCAGNGPGVHWRNAMLPRTILAASLASAVLLSSARLAPAQMLFGVEGATGSAHQFTFAPGPCGYPSPLVTNFPLTVPGHPCATPGPFGAGIIGDVAFDKITETLYASDGIVLTAYAPGGAVKFSTTAAAILGAGKLIKGLGFDSANNRLFVTDGNMVLAITPPIGMPCVGALPPIAWGPFILTPLLGGAQILDLAYDVVGDALWTSDTANTVRRFDLAGAVVGVALPALGAAFSTAPHGLLGPLPGIAWDSARDAVIVTDGWTIARLSVAGALAPATFYAPQSMFLSPLGGAIAGLEFSARAARYGANCSAFGAAPDATGLGQSYAGNASFALRLTGALPNRDTAVWLNVSALCPGMPIGVCSLYVAPAGALLVIAKTDAAGSLTLPVPLPAVPYGAFPTGLTAHAQFFVPSLGPGTGQQASQALAFTISAP